MIIYANTANNILIEAKQPCRIAASVFLEFVGRSSETECQPVAAMADSARHFSVDEPLALSSHSLLTIYFSMWNYRHGFRP